jgi:hypothetical protein
VLNAVTALVSVARDGLLTVVLAQAAMGYKERMG